VLQVEMQVKTRQQLVVQLQLQEKLQVGQVKRTQVKRNDIDLFCLK
jgi:hypothetical protein